MLQEEPGCYDHIGNCVGSKDGRMVHNPNCDFNDEILSHGGSYWVMLVATRIKQEN